MTRYGDDPAVWVAAEIQRLRNLSFEDLYLLLDNEEHRAMRTAGGSELVLETHVFWDDRKKQSLRVIVDVWDFAKLSIGAIAKDSFIRSADGSFIGE